MQHGKSRTAFPFLTAARRAGRSLVGAVAIGAALAVVGWPAAGTWPAVVVPALAAPAAEEVETVQLQIAKIGTAGKSRCGQALSTLGTNCLGFDGRDVRSLEDLWVVGFENNAETGEKHVLQTVVTVDLGQLRGLPEKAEVTTSQLWYGEVSTVRRSATGDSEYGILPTCNTRLGVAEDGWNGNLDGVVPTKPANATVLAGATTAESGAWDVTPQIREWLKADQNQRTFVLRSEDESLDVKGQAMCLSYVVDISLAADVTTPD